LVVQLLDPVRWLVYTLLMTPFIVSGAESTKRVFNIKTRMYDIPIYLSCWLYITIVVWIKTGVII